ncbi:ribosome biogenesis GTPase YlqF [Aquibacillus koreensis]|uniref:Ribosome biogenesis GTPase A n=1 Tax=Aquibacillus koreensis TaxID=279446 RepID=A0A9X3WKR1_9BACI|nr:ribosome biogenesis GTPase YlqF [Aquibacillus koreensis]MCT2534504.1 ribosome biogenesis GTPase YlqF [Aquibacillus koreensis]MDC3421902.1 ribosome biogenesis GTPase YlqF [Aquibacillus koreensis]
MTIQWFPGHMAKAKRQVQEKLKLVDFVIELVDARAPESSQNPMLHQVLQEKPKMIVLMKKDLADPIQTEAWIQTYKTKDIPAIAVDVQQKQDIQQVISLAKEMGKAKLEKMIKKGIRPRPARAMIIGIPNVGKSTLINRLANKKIAKTGDRPGVTTSQQWIKVKKDFELLDTPGILWPKFEDQQVGYRLAAIGTIKDQILSLQDIAAFAITYLQQHYPAILESRFQISHNQEDMAEIFEEIGRLRGCLESGGKINYEKTADIIIRDLRSGRIGRVTLEKPA